MRFEMKDCGGCRTCAMACSYKFTGEFNSDHAAIRIIEREDGMGFDVELIDDEGEEYLCDGCLEYDTPLCVQFCHFKEELTSFINILLESKKEGQDHG
jgi:Fe-S-cluster-containing dehydrogenase component